MTLITGFYHHNTNNYIKYFILTAVFVNSANKQHLLALALTRADESAYLFVALVKLVATSVLFQHLI